MQVPCARVAVAYTPFVLALEIKRDMIGIYFESIGVLVKKSLIETSAIDDMMSGYVIGYWRAH
jgi:hypothetical protein